MTGLTDRHYDLHGQGAKATSMEIDDLDRQIVAFFHDSPRATNRALARQLGVAEATVASRIRKLVANRVLKFTIQRDLRALGYAFQASAGIFVAGRAADAVAADLAKVPAIQTVVLLQNTPDILTTINAGSLSELLATVTREIETIEGIRNVQLDLIVDVLKFETKFGMVRTV